MQFQVDTTLIGAIILPALSLLFAIWSYFQQKRKKQIAYRIVSTTSLPTFDKPVKELTNPDKQIIIQYTNTGNTALETSDFHSKITTEFISGTLIKAELHKTFQNDGVYAEIKFNGSTSSFIPDLMNRHDSIYFSYIVRDFKNKIHVDTKIRNGKSVYNKPVYDILIGRVLLISSLYLGMVINNWIKTNTLGSRIEHYYFFLLITPLIVMSFIQIRRKIKEQHVLYFTWDISSRR